MLSVECLVFKIHNPKFKIHFGRNSGIECKPYNRNSGMSIRRLLTFFLLLTVIISFYPANLPAQVTRKEKDSQETEFQAQTGLYLFKRSLEFEAEAYLHESFLLWLYQGITAEARKRHSEDWQSTLAAFEVLDLATFEDSVYVLPEDLEDAPPRIRYQAWEKLQREKYNHKYIQARRIKDKLIKSATSQQRERMFNTDLSSAIISYRNELYHEAILRFNELETRYGYDDMSDIVFFRGECYFKLSMYDRARTDYIYTYKNSNDRDIRCSALERLIAIEGDKGDIRSTERYWQKYLDEVGEAKDKYYYRVASMTARYLMALREWNSAQALYDEINPKSKGYVQAKLLAADCSLAMYARAKMGFLSLDTIDTRLNDARFRYTEIAEGEIKGKGLTKEIRGEALLKLGYIDFLNGDYYAAYDKVTRIKGEGELAEKALIIAAWSRFRVYDYGDVISLCYKFLETYVESEYFYEIFCLLGYSEELLGREEDARREYEEVIGAVDDQREFHSINYEKKQVISALGELQRLEPVLFLSGKLDVFERYSSLRKKLKSLFERLKLTEGIKSSPLIREMLDEQKKLYAVFKELMDMEKELFALDDSKLLGKYDKMYANLVDLATDLKSGLRYEMEQKSLVQREQEGLFQTRAGDSLDVDFNKEWRSTERTLQNVRDMMSQAEAVDDDETLLKLGEIELGLMSIQDRLMGVRTNLSQVQPYEIDSKLDHWSWFAYQRHSTAGLAFDYLYMRESRLLELDQYIDRVNNIIAERQVVEEELVELPENLIPASEPGAEPYYAPRVPLWKPPEPEKPEVDTTAVSDIEDHIGGEELEPGPKLPDEGLELEGEGLEIPSEEQLIDEEPAPQPDSEESEEVQEELEDEPVEGEDKPEETEPGGEDTGAEPSD